MLYKQLKLDGSPVGGVCGLLYPESNHRKEHKNKRKKRQPGIGSGRWIKLPAAGDARSAFRQILEALDEHLF